MNKLNLFLLTLLIIIFACSQKEETVKLEPGTAAYMLAKDLSETLPSVDPDSNTILISTNKFDVSTGEVIKVIYSNFGPRSAELKGMTADRVKMILESNAEKLGEQKLVLYAAKEMGIEISQSELDSMLQVQYERAGGEEAFVKQLSNHGLTIDFVKEDIRNATMIKQYMDKILTREMVVSDKALKDRYQELLKNDRTASVRHILLLTQGKSEQEKKEIYDKAKRIHEMAKSGRDFADLAKKYSEDPGSKNKGGLYENFTRGTMVKPFEEAAFSVPIGEVSDIVETRYGYHILKIVDRQKETRSFAEMEDDLKKELRGNKEKGFVDEHIAKLKSEADYQKISL